MVLIFSLACSNEAEIIEPEVSEDSIVFPFDSRDNGKFLTIYRNYSDKTIPITFALIKQNEIFENSQNYDFCPDIMNIRKGINSTDWILINYNLAIVSEKSVQNINDHPNLVSYSLPKGTWIAFLMERAECNEDQYEVIDILTNEGVQISQ